MLAALVITAFLGYATSGACNFDPKTAGLCGITNTGSSVEIGGSYEVPGTSPPVEITVLEKRTALVQYTRIEDPRGPGCP